MSVRIIVCKWYNKLVTSTLCLYDFLIKSFNSQ
jgi:hypothetical protein